ncbi:MAG: amidohydrolase [Ruminococcaceae bacterium]|nr:amidohydrolase [Oscillospiraceae bacterium]
MNAVNEAKRIEQEIIDMRRELHQCPELKMEMDLTEKLILSYLKQIGIEEIRTGIGGKGIAAVIRGQSDTPCLGIRADCDGLPIQEDTGLPFASKNGNMHACGHDAHTAMALGAAKILYEHRHELPCTVKFIFQPYEEGGGGAKPMVADGVLENPHVDAMVALHTGNIFNGDFVGGDFACHPKVMSFNITAFRATFSGKGSHVSTPHLSRDPVYAACAAVTQLQTLISRNRNPASPAVAAVTMIHGGVRNNIIPEECVIEGSLRSPDKEEQTFLFERMGEIVKGIAAANGVEGTLEQVFHVPGMRIDRRMYDAYRASAEKIIGKERVKEMTELTPAGEDFSFFSEERPSVYFFHCSKFADKENYPHHHPKFDIDEAQLWSGSAFFAQFAMDFKDAWENR